MSPSHQLIKVLYIDDYVFDRELVRDALLKEHSGFHLTEAANKKEFLDVLKTHSFDVVLSDFNIAGFEGLEVIETLRSIDPTIPVIIVTGTGSEEIAVRAMQQGATDYVIKRPNHIRRLPQTILAAIDKKQLRIERQKAELRVRESEERLRNIIQRIPAAILIYDVDKGYVKSNEAAERLLGMTASQLLGKKNDDPGWNLIDEQGRRLAPAEYPIAQAISQQAVIMNRVVGMISPDSEEPKWLMVSATPELDSSGKVNDVITSFVDISDRKRTVQALRISEDRLKMADEASNDGLWDWDMASGEVYFSPTYYTMLGYEPYEFPQTFSAWSELLHPEDQDTVRAEIVDHLQHKDTPFEYEFRLRKKSGDWLWVLGKGKVFLRDTEGLPLRAIGTHTDIDSLKNMQYKLHESIEKYWSILNNVELGIALVNPQLQILETNRMMKKWYPDIDEFDLPTCFELAHAPDKTGPCEDCPVVLTFKDGQVHENTRESQINGQSYIFREIASPIHDEKGRVSSVIRLLEDVTEKHREEKHLRHSQKMESLGTLAGGIAHDFNNILTAVIGFAELSLTDAGENSPLLDDLREILTAGKRAQDLVSRILTFSRQGEQNYKPTYVAPVTEEALSMMKSVLPSSISIEKDIDGDAGMVMSDTTQLHQIVINLCTNAGHAMEEKGGKLKVSLRQIVFDEAMSELYLDMPQGEYIHLSICDSGHGISPDILEKIFDPYFTTKEEGKGSGLGLAMVHGLVKAHGGHVAVYSEENKGTCFHVYLPRIADDSVPSIVSLVEAIPSGSERILLVDDELPILKMERRILENLGYHVSTVSSSVEALKMFLESQDVYDLIITDMTMPEMTGDVLAREIKTVRPDIPIIICTGFNSKIDSNNISQFPINALLYKPIESRVLAATVRNVLDEAYRASS